MGYVASSRTPARHRKPDAAGATKLTGIQKAMARGMRSAQGTGPEPVSPVDAKSEADGAGMPPANQATAFGASILTAMNRT